jgi:guanine deaminase
VRVIGATACPRLDLPLSPRNLHMAKIAIRGDLLDLPRDPGLTSVDAAAVRWRPDHWLMVESGVIVDATDVEPGADWNRIDRRGHLILPGFIDTHVHLPQLEVMASYGTGLLDWLERYTFPAELRYSDAEHAEQGARRFLDALLAQGTTSAAVFATVHEQSADALAHASAERGMRIIGGKVLMDRHAPAGLLDPAGGGIEAARRHIRRWHGRDRLSCAVTVRFAATSTPAQLSLAGALLDEVPDLYMQTHLAETREEVAWIASLFPEARSYLDVYARHGLLGPRSIFAHGIWLDATDREALANAGACIAHCPGSNLFLGSGLMDWKSLDAASVPVTLATDVGGGTSLSMTRAMAQAYEVQSLQGLRLTAWTLLHAATHGAAAALGLDREIGLLEPGRCADFTVWRWQTGSVQEWRQAHAKALHERVFAWLMLATPGNLRETWVRGRRVAGSDACAVDA